MTALPQISEEFLKSACPHLLVRAEPTDKLNGVELNPYIRNVYIGWDEIFLEGYDPDQSLLGCPVYWRFVRQGAERLYVSTFAVSHDQIMKVWGSEGLSFVDPITRVGVGRVETSLRRIAAYCGPIGELALRKAMN